MKLRSTAVAALVTVWSAGAPIGQRADRSVIYKINPDSGTVKKLSQRYRGYVDLAFDTCGRSFVARPDAGKVSVIKKGRSSTCVRLPDVVSVETDEHGQRYAVRDARTGADAHDTDLVRVG